MDLVIEHRPGDVRVILQGPADSAELQRILSLLQNHSDKLWCLDEERNTVALSAGQVLWAETVDDKFLFTQSILYTRRPAAWPPWNCAGNDSVSFGAENPPQLT